MRGEIYGTNLGKTPKGVPGPNNGTGTQHLDLLEQLLHVNNFSLSDKAKTLSFLKPNQTDMGF